MRLTVKKPRRYGEARVVSEEAPITAVPNVEESVNNGVIPMVGEVPYHLANAYADSVVNAENAKETQDTLNKMADEAFPSAKDIKAIDKEAVGKARDYDYEHPVVDSIYTGKFILDESLIMEDEEKKPKTRDAFVDEFVDTVFDMADKSNIEESIVEIDSKFAVKLYWQVDEEQADADDVFHKQDSPNEVLVATLVELKNNVYVHPEDAYDYYVVDNGMVTGEDKEAASANELYNEYLEFTNQLSKEEKSKILNPDGDTKVEVPEKFSYTFPTTIADSMYNKMIQSPNLHWSHGSQESDSGIYIDGGLITEVKNSTERDITRSEQSLLNSFISFTKDFVNAGDNANSGWDVFHIDGSVPALSVSSVVATLDADRKSNEDEIDLSHVEFDVDEANVFLYIKENGIKSTYFICKDGDKYIINNDLNNLVVSHNEDEFSDIVYKFYADNSQLDVGDFYDDFMVLPEKIGRESTQKRADRLKFMSKGEKVVAQEKTKADQIFGDNTPLGNAWAKGIFNIGDVILDETKKEIGIDYAIKVCNGYSFEKLDKTPTATPENVLKHPYFYVILDSNHMDIYIAAGTISAVMFPWEFNELKNKLDRPLIKLNIAVPKTKTKSSFEWGDFKDMPFFTDSKDTKVDASEYTNPDGTINYKILGNKENSDRYDGATRGLTNDKMKAYKGIIQKAVDEIDSSNKKIVSCQNKLVKNKKMDVDIRKKYEDVISSLGSQIEALKVELNKPSSKFDLGKISDLTDNLTKTRQSADEIEGKEDNKETN